MLRLSLGLALLLLCAALVLREGLVRHAEASRPDLAARLWPASGNALALLALERARQSEGMADAAGQRLIAQAMARIPAAGLPLALAGLDASARGDLPRATALMEAARHRSPRLALVRGWLINEYARTGRYDAVMAEAGPVMRLSVDSRPQVYALIAAIAARPDGKAAVAGALAADPDWRLPYQQWLAAQGPAAAQQ